VDRVSRAADDGPQPAVPSVKAAASLGLPAVIGHRGAAGAAPENTLAGIRKAREFGATWVEFDVKLTKDGHAILFHDDRLERTTDGQGAVAATTLAEIRSLDAGGWFGAAFRGEPVPTFEQALALCAELGLGINVEIKPCVNRAAETAQVTMSTLLELWPLDRPAPLVSSFAPACLRVARDLAPQVPRGYLAGTLPRRWRELMAAYGCTTMHLNHRRMLPGQRAALLTAGIPVVLYTVNDGARARQHLEAGIAGVITDHVDLVLRCLEQEPIAS
jgi:glycerophosphoryl diester phosphodiesterase